MRKFLILFSILIGTMVSSCSSSDNSPEPSSVADVASSTTLRQLREANEAFIATLNFNPSKSMSPTDGNIVLADLTGAYYGAKLGGMIGGHTGAVIGGLIGGASASYLEYKEKQKPENAKDVSVDNVTEAYLTIEERLSEISILNIPARVDSLEKVGLYHNEILRELRKNEMFTLEPLDLVNPKDDDFQHTRELSFMEKLTLSSQIYKTGYESMCADISADQFDFIPEAGSIADNIMTLYINAITEATGASPDSITALTNQYINTITGSTEITNDEKDNLYLALAVAAYSYKYWSQQP